MSEEQGMYGVPGLIPWTVRDQHAVVLIQGKKIAELRAVLQAVLDHHLWLDDERDQAFFSRGPWRNLEDVMQEQSTRWQALRERIRAALGEGAAPVPLLRADCGLPTTELVAVPTGPEIEGGYKEWADQLDPRAAAGMLSGFRAGVRWLLGRGLPKTERPAVSAPTDEEIVAAATEYYAGYFDNLDARMGFKDGARWLLSLGLHTPEPDQPAPVAVPTDEEIRTGWMDWTYSWLIERGVPPPELDDEVIDYRPGPPKAEYLVPVIPEPGPLLVADCGCELWADGVAPCDEAREMRKIEQQPLGIPGGNEHYYEQHIVDAFKFYPRPQHPSELLRWAAALGTTPEGLIRGLEARYMGTEAVYHYRWVDGQMQVTATLTMCAMEPVDLAAYREAHIELIGERKPRSWEGCKHKKHWVDTDLRRVTCQDCGEVLDPIECILGYVDFWAGAKGEIELLLSLRREQREKGQRQEMRRMARTVARDGGVWACRVDGPHTWYYDNSQPEPGA